MQWFHSQTRTVNGQHANPCSFSNGNRTHRVPVFAVDQYFSFRIERSPGDAGLADEPAHSCIYLIPVGAYNERREE